MTRKLAKIVHIDELVPIAGADAIEAAKVGGWAVVVKKGEYQPGDLAVYFEIDSFLPDGKPAWQFLVDKSSRMFNGVKGHVLQSIKLRGQVSQGLLLPLNIDARIEAADQSNVGYDATEILGVVKYEAPVPAELAGSARGLFPSVVSKTDQERIQNLGSELGEWIAQGGITWEVTEKLEGASCTFAWIDGELHVCSRNIDLMDTPGNSLWRLAHDLGIQDSFVRHFLSRNLALQGEIVGFGVQGNIYGMRSQKFFLFDVFDVDKGRYLTPYERREVAEKFRVEHVPVIDRAFVLPFTDPMDYLLALADGHSALKNGQLREGLVFKCNQKPASFKAVSNKYLLKQTLDF